LKKLNNTFGKNNKSEGFKMNNTEINQDVLSKKLITAVSDSDINKIKRLIEQGADIEFDGNRALMVACQKGEHSVVTMLIKADANIFQNNNEALYHAVTHRHAIVTAILLEEGADVMDREGSILNALTKKYTCDDAFSHLANLTPSNFIEWDSLYLLEVAIEQENLFLKQIITAALSEEKRADAIQIALDSKKADIETAKYLLAQGINFDQDDELAGYIMMRAWNSGAKELLPLIVASGASLSEALCYHQLQGGTEFIDNDYLQTCLQLSNYEQEVCEYVAWIAIPDHIEAAKNAIRNLSESNKFVSKLFLTALLHQTEALYPYFIALNPHIIVDRDNYECIDSILHSCTDRKLICYLLEKIGYNSLPDDIALLSWAIKEKDWDWFKWLYKYGLRPTPQEMLQPEVFYLVAEISSSEKNNTSFGFGSLQHIYEDPQSSEGYICPSCDSSEDICAECRLEEEVHYE